MKLNKKVFAGALALAMGLGVVAPAANSYAADKDPAGQVAITEDYRKAEKAYIAALDAKTAAKKALEEATDARKAAEKVRDEAKAALEKFDAEKAALEAELKEVKALRNSSYQNYRANGGTKSLDEINEETVVTETGTKEQQETQAEELRDIVAKNTRIAELNNSIAGYTDSARTKLRAELNRRQGDVDEAINDEDAAKAAYEAAVEAYKKAKKRFVKAGANKNTIDLAERYGVYVPEGEVEEEKDLTEKIEASLKVNKEKLSALKAVKEYMPESYKKYKKVIDEAVEAAEKAIKQAEDFLGKKVAFLTVAHASEEAPTAEEVLKDLEDSEKKLDDAINQVEQDNKEQNEAEEENKEEEEKPADKEEEEKPADKEEEKKPEVTEKEDKTPSTNVKTGVAGVAGVGAVLAAASAAYVSSKRK